MRGVACFHGLRIAWTTSGLATDPARALFDGLAEIGDDTRPVDLTLRIGRAPAGAGEDGYRPSFRQGNVRVFERDGALLIVAPAARVIVSNDGTRIEATVVEATLDRRGFTNTTLVIALALALRHRGLFHMHAGGLVRGDGTRVLVMGDSGSGKTTTTLGLLDSRARHLGDDTLFLAARDGRAYLLAFPRPFHLGPATARAFPAIPATIAEGDAKVQVARGDLPGVPVEQMAAPHVVLFPQVTREATSRASELSKADAFGLAIRSSAFVVVDGLGQKKEQLALLASLLEGARAFELHLGSDWLDAPARAAECVPWGQCSEAT